ncbi:MAG: hypothetical protein SGARI_007418 [Bacillariaceae sp.]
MLRQSKSLLISSRKSRRLPSCFQKPRANLSTETTTSSNSADASASLSADAIAAREALSALPEGFQFQPVVRNGPGDAIITINVGGKDFKTLRSTVQASPVLCETIAIAEAQGEFTYSDGKAIFVDRDPTHFPLILTYLRNKVEGIAYNDKSIKQTAMAGGVKKFVTLKSAKHPQYVRLPQDQGTLQDLYVEATHFGLHQLCHTSFMVTVASWFGGGGNPFLQANEALKSLRRTFFAVAGTTSIMGAMQAELDWVKGLLGIPVEKSEGGGDGGDKSSEVATPTAEPSLA